MRWGTWVPAAAGLGLGLLALGPGLAPGFLLSYDMVFVPDPAFTKLTFGLTGTVPRHVPSDAVVAALGLVAPGWVVQKLLLLAVFVMASAAAATLVPSDRPLPRLVAGVCYAWNPFVAERLLLGQWALLLGYAALPWVIAAAFRTDEARGGRRLLLALVPAAIGGFAALAVSGLAAVVVGTRRLKVVAALAVLSLPWLVPGLLRPGGVPGDGTGVDAFAARADTPFGTVGSVLLLGGVWNGETVPTGYGMWVTATLWGIVVVLALASYVHYRDRLGPWAARAGYAAAAGFAVALAGFAVPGVLESLIGLWPGFAVFRDGQQFAAPLAAVVAAGLGIGADRALHTGADRALHTGADRALEARYAPLAAGALLAPVAFLPSLAWGAAGDLRPVDYPASWARAEQIIDNDPRGGDVLVLPWAAYRSYEWNHGRRVLEPLPRYLGRRVVVNDSVQVGDTALAPEDPRARHLDAAIRSGRPLTAPLREAGIGYVAVDVPAPAAAVPGGPKAVAERLPGARRVLEARDLTLYRIPGAAPAAADGVPVVPVVLAWIASLGGIFWSMVTVRTTLVPPLLRSIPRRRAP